MSFAHLAATGTSDGALWEANPDALSAMVIFHAPGITEQSGDGGLAGAHRADEHDARSHR